MNPVPKCGRAIRLATLLLRHTDGPATTPGRLGVLATDAEAPEVTQTTVSPDLLQALEVITQLRVDAVGEDLAVLAVDDVALSVEEPTGDLVLGRVLDDGDNALEFFRGKLSGAVINMSVLSNPQIRPARSQFG